MRILYFILKVTLNYALRVFYPRMAFNNSPKNPFGRTIYVSNHAASFMDPLTVASLRMPIVFFMTRSDVFTTMSKPFLWACQMLPIYRQHDGQDTKGKNEEVFKTCTRILSFGRNLLIFGEGFTDDTFIRRLKPVKKGAARIGFSTLDSIGWNKKIYMCAVGCNYSSPNKMRSDLLISHSDKFCLNDYEEQYKENPNKAISEVTKRIEKLMQEQITHVENKELAPTHEHIMEITRKGMNANSFDRSRSLKQRWKYSQELAHWINNLPEEKQSELTNIQQETDTYFTLLKRFKMEERLVFWKMNSSGSRLKEVLSLILLFPFAILGMIHCALPYILVKGFVEKSFRRNVFWGSVKLIMGMILIGLINIPVIFLLYHFVYPSYWLGFAYYAAIGLFGLAAYQWFWNLKEFKKKGIMKKANIDKLIEKRNNLEQLIQSVLPSNFH